MFFVLLSDYTFFMAGSFTFFFIAIGSIELRNYRVVFCIQKRRHGKPCPLIFQMPHPNPSQNRFRSTQFPRKSAANIPGHLES